jgi:cytochrome P450
MSTAETTELLATPTEASPPDSYQRMAGRDPYSVPLDEINVSEPELFRTDTIWGFFERLRNEAPVHYCKASEAGPYWSITKFHDIVYVEKHPEIFSSEPTIGIANPDPNSQFQNAGFITMDGPRHDAHRKVVQPVSSPRNLKKMEPLIRAHASEILDGLPQGETFDWVDRVSIELTTRMLATMFDFSFEERRKLTFWSDIATAGPELLAERGMTTQDREEALLDCLSTFTRLWHERRGTDPDELDFVTALANADATQDLDPITYMGTLALLIVGGNDTTRNSISGGVLALNEHPAEYEKLRADNSLIPNMVDEIIRWQTPLSYMRRTATCDTELGGQQIKQGDKVVMWYVSGNRDETAIDRANEFLIDRSNANHHLSFGWGVHFCMGSRVAQLQLRVLWEEIMKRFRSVEVVGEPVRVKHNLIHGFAELPVQVHPW